MVMECDSIEIDSRYLFLKRPPLTLSVPYCLSNMHILSKQEGNLFICSFYLSYVLFVITFYH